MNTSKLKNIIIIVLILLNLFLLAVVLADKASERSDRDRTGEEIRRVLESSGISAGSQLDFFIEAPGLCTVSREAAGEKKIVDNLLGETYFKDLGGNIYFYSSEKGQASVRGAGELDIIFNGGVFSARGRPEKAALRILSRAGISADPDSVLSTATGDGFRTELCCLWNGCPVYNAKLYLDFSEDSLIMISGTRTFDRLVSESSEGVMDCVSAVMRFVEIVQSNGFICSRIDGIEAGYLMSVAVSGESTLTPLWRISADTGELYINALTGAVENLPA